MTSGAELKGGVAQVDRGATASVVDCEVAIVGAGPYGMGLVEMEYKLDPRDLRYKLLDVNARTWGYHSLGASVGVDFSYMLHADQLGLPVSVCKARPGIGWVRMTTDIPTVFLEFLAGQLSPMDYLRSLRMCRTEAVFSCGDPVPGIMETLLTPYLAFKRGF